MQSHESLEGCEDGPVASKMTTEDDAEEDHSGRTASGHVGGLRAEDRANPLAHSSVAFAAVWFAKAGTAGVGQRLQAARVLSLGQSDQLATA